MSKYTAIAIDGPAGAGKTTLAKELARRLNRVYVDTGAIYRAFAVHKTWLEKEQGEVISNETALRTFDFELERDENGEQLVFVWSKNVNEYLRTEEISMLASTLSADPVVREALLGVQRRYALHSDVVMEGRDIGTTVLPDADVKIFLTAAVDERAYRRYRDLRKAGKDPDLVEVVNALRERDLQDSMRAASPLKQAEDAILVDNSNMNFDETVQHVLAIVRSRLATIEIHKLANEYNIPEYESKVAEIVKKLLI